VETPAKIALTPEQETLLIPLYCKARVDNPVFDDVKARDILGRLNYDFRALHIPRKTCIMMSLRAHQFDAYTREFIDAHPDAVVLHLGCGLDSRCRRVNGDAVEWYDLDMPAVIDLRRKFYTETDRYHLLPSSATDPGWMRNVAAEGRPVLVIAEGLFMYLTGDEVKSLVLELVLRFPGCHLVFDAYSRLTASRVKDHPSMRKTGASVRWGLDDPHEVEHWGSGILLKEERCFGQFAGIERLSAGYRLAFRLSGLVPAARRAHRILYYLLQYSG
jgi:O-methyltransferase involved in polyketide biosynthesis